MYSGLTEAEETVDAVLQDVVDSTQQWSEYTAEATQAFGSQQMPQSVPEQQHSFSADQDPERRATALDTTELSSYGLAVPSDALSSMLQVESAVNPLFLPAEPSRPQSAQLQQTLSAMSRQLLALEESMQQQPEAAQSSVHSAETVTAAASALQQGDIAFSSSAEPQSYTGQPLPSIGASVSAATSNAALPSGTDVTNGLQANVAEGNMAPSASSAASPSAEADATAASMLTTAADQPAMTLDNSTAAAAHDATFTAWTPPLPEIPAVRMGAPRRSAAFRHSISAMSRSKPHTSSKHHSIPSLSTRYSKFVPQHEYILSQGNRSLNKEADAVPNAENATDLLGSRRSVLKRPATAGQARSQTALHHQELGPPASRPQTAAASAGRAWPSGRSPQRQGQLPWMHEDDFKGSPEMPHSPVRERMKNAVERESCLRLEAEMAALDVGELLQQKVAAEAAAQAEAHRSASLQAQLIKLQEELCAARHDASRQHAWELQLQLRTAEVTSAALQKQLAEAEQEIEAEHERSKAAEQALEVERRRRQAAEYAQSQPSSPLRDPALQTELASLRAKVAEMTGCLQAEQGKSSLITQMASQHLSAPVSATTPASKQPVGLPSLNCLHTDAAKEVVDGSNEEEQNSSSQSKEEENQEASSQTGGEEEQKPSSLDRDSAATSFVGRNTKQQPTGCQPLHSQPDSASVKHAEEASNTVPRMTDMHKTLERLAETLSQDVLKLQKALEGQSRSINQDGDPQSLWGFAKPDVGATPGPSRPVTAAQCGSSHRPNRQWSAGSARFEAMPSADQQNPRSGREKPSTANDGDQRFQRVDKPSYSPAGQALARRSKRHMEDSWQDPVPPSRMPEDILRQAREDYLQEKNRVRDKRLRELSAKQGSVAATHLSSQ